MSSLARQHPADEPRLDLCGVPFVVTAEGALFAPGDRLLVVADLHLEKASRHAARGRFLPPYDTPVTLARLAALVARTEPKTVICLGDSFDDAEGAGRLDASARAALAALQRGRDWIWVAGNHDPGTSARVGGTSAEEIRLGPLVLRHEPRRGPAAGEIAGHLHPAAVVRGTGAAVRARCVVTDGTRAILPAFGAFAGGLDLRDPAFNGLFDRGRLIAYVLGAERVYAVPGARCLGR